MLVLRLLINGLNRLLHLFLRCEVIYLNSESVITNTLWILMECDYANI